MNKSKIHRRILRVRKKVKSVSKNRYRLSIYKSTKNILAQIIDDKHNKTLAYASSVEKDLAKNKNGNKSSLSILVGELLAKRAKENKITKVFFDRGKFKFHGRVKLLADTLRKNGLEF